MRNIHPRFFICFLRETISAVTTGGQGCRAPPDGCLCPPFWFTNNTVFGTSRNDKTTDCDGKIAVHKSSDGHRGAVHQRALVAPLLFR